MISMEIWVGGEAAEGDSKTGGQRYGEVVEEDER
jgi:hypothetical protein